MEEAQELARICAKAINGHPENIRGAKTIAGCIYLKRTERFDTEGKIRNFVSDQSGYDLDGNRDSIAIAVNAYLEKPYSSEKAIRQAIFSGRASGTIACMTAEIATTEASGVISSSCLSDKIEKKCREMLSQDLLEINDRFMAFINRPLYQSYKIIGKTGEIYAGEYPGDRSPSIAQQKIRNMIHFGIRHFIDLTEEGELRPYSHLLPEKATYLRFPIRDCGVPESQEQVHQLIHRIKELQALGGYIYIHCRGGVGRTGTIAACYLASQNKEAGFENIIASLRRDFSQMPKSAYRKTPETAQQMDFIKRFIESLKSDERMTRERIKDCIRGCLIAGAAGDALGLPVESMSRKMILSLYGPDGMSAFKLDSKGKALVGSNTQMSLYTANGLLMGMTRSCMRGIGCSPEEYTIYAYYDWYHTQTDGKKTKSGKSGPYTWLRDLPELAFRRAPGATCLQACESSLNMKEVCNESKGCGGITRVAPLALFWASIISKGEVYSYTVPEMFEAGVKIASFTHKHPLGFLPAGMLTALLFNLVPLSPDEARKRFVGLVEEAIKVLGQVFPGQYIKEKRHLAELTASALSLSVSDTDDIEAIKRIGTGWTADEAWAISLFCTLRHIDSVRDAIAAAVNHDGNSDAPGSITGNLMGVIHGYEQIRKQHLFCERGSDFENVLELSGIILAMADDLNSGCIISEYSPIDTPEKRQWYDRYCEMIPSGIR